MNKDINFDKEFINNKENRMSGKDYFLFRLYVILFFFLATGISFIIYIFNLPIAIIFFIIFLITYSFYISSFSYKTTMKRFHDMNKSGQWASSVIKGMPFLFNLNPFIMFTKKDKNENKYGQVASLNKKSILNYVFRIFLKSLILTLIFLLVIVITLWYGNDFNSFS